ATSWHRFDEGTGSNSRQLVESLGSSGFDRAGSGKPPGPFACFSPGNDQGGITCNPFLFRCRLQYGLGPEEPLRETPMRHFRFAVVGLILGSFFLLAASGNSQDKAKDRDKVAGPDKAAIKAAVEKGFDYLMKNQAQNGSWGKTFNIAVTSFAILAFLSADDEPFRDERGKAL